MSPSVLGVTSRLPFDALANAIAARLAADLPTLKFFCLWVPENDPQTLPYVVLELMSAADETSTKTDGEWVVDCKFLTFTVGFGVKVATDIMNTIILALGRDSLAISLLDDFELEDVEAGSPSITFNPGDGFTPPQQDGELPLRFRIRDLNV
jgi:hypothetical protein